MAELRQVLRGDAADSPSTPYRPLAPEILQGAFGGNGTMAWLRGIHRKRRSLPTSRTIGGIRLQDTCDAIGDATFALTAMRIHYLPDEEGAALRGQLTISADRSHLSARAMQDMPMFIAATDEALTMLEKWLNTESPPRWWAPGAHRSGNHPGSRGIGLVPSSTARPITGSSRARPSRG